MNAGHINKVYSLYSKNEMNVFQTVSHCHHVFIHQECFSGVCEDAAVIFSSESVTLKPLSFVLDEGVVK